MADVLKQNIIELINDIKDNLCDSKSEKMDMVIAEIYFRNTSPSEIMSKFILNVLPHASQIRNHDKVFFLENRQLFEGLPPKKIDYYCKKLGSDVLSQEDEKAIWDYFDNMIILVEDFKKKM